MKCTQELTLAADYDEAVFAACFDCANEDLTWGWGSSTLWQRYVGTVTQAVAAQAAHDAGEPTEPHRERRP